MESSKLRKISKVVFYTIIVATGVLLVLLILHVLEPKNGLLKVVQSNLPVWGKPDNNQGVYYLLSSISQGLAAAFALTFTITLFCMQISARYGQKAMSRFFSPLVLIYMGFFVLSILFPLFLMNDPNSQLVNLSLFFSFIALVFLIPYFYSIKKKLTIQVILDGIFSAVVKEVRRRFRTAEYDKGINELDTLYEIVMNTYSGRDFEGYRFGIDRIIKAGIEVEKIYITHKSDHATVEMTTFAIFSTSEPFITIQDIINEVLGNYRSIQIIVKRLRENGTASAKGKLGISTKRILECLSYSFDRVISTGAPRWNENRLDMESSSEVARECLYDMESIAGICSRNNLKDSVTFTAHKLFEKALSVMDMNRDEYDRLILVSVGQAGTLSWSTIAAGKIDITESIMKKLWILGAIFFSRDLSHFVTVANEIKDFRQFYTDVLMGNITSDNVNRTHASSHYRSRLHDFFRLDIDLGLIDRSLYSRDNLSSIFERSYQEAIDSYDEVSQYFDGAAQYATMLNGFREMVG